jgi:6-methylsalicylate decarboxylase
VNIDVHQHIWPQPLIAALRARTGAPRLHGWTLELAGEPDYDVAPRDHDPTEREAVARADGYDLVLIAPSSPLGIEFLVPDEAHELLDAYHEGVLALPSCFGAWASACLTAIDPAELERLLDRGCVGLTLPATVLAGGEGYARVRPLLEVLERRGRPLFVHPGPAARGDGSNPQWWPALVDYVQQMHAAWFAFRVHGRPNHRRLRVCFAMLAGLAPLHGERFAARAGERTAVDADVFLEVSSYGSRAIDATIRVLGIDPLLGGSDRPYAAPPRIDLGPAVSEALFRTNPARLLDHKEVPHGPMAGVAAKS